MNPRDIGALQTARRDLLRLLREQRLWWSFDPQRHRRIAETLRRALRTRKRDEAQAESIIDKLESAVLFYVPQPGQLADRDWPLPAKIGKTAHALIEAITEALTDCDTDTQHARIEMLRRLVGGEYEWSQDIYRDDATLEWHRVFGSEWIEALARLAKPPRARNRPRGEQRRALEDAVIVILKRARLTWCDGPLAARVLVEVLEHVFGDAPRSEEAEREVLRRAVRRRDELAKELRRARAQKTAPR